MFTDCFTSHNPLPGVEMHCDENSIQIRSGFCGDKNCNHPVRMSPVPPVAIPGLPVVLTQTVPSGLSNERAMAL